MPYPVIADKQPLNLCGGFSFCPCSKSNGLRSNGDLCSGARVTFSVDVTLNRRYNLAMQSVNFQSLFTSMMTSSSVLRDHPMISVDVGARDAPKPHWPLYGPHVRVIGFEPAADECQRLNKVKDTFHVPYHCYPVGLGSTNETRRLYHYATNAAANSVYPPNTQHDFEYTEVDIRRFDDFAAEHNISRVDFMKLDIERHELEALKGLGHFLSDERPILGFEIEVHFVPWNDTPLLSEIELYLRPFGYRLMDIDLMRTASPALPTPVAWDHRNEKNEPVKGPTLTGPLTTADALFFLDPNTLHTKHGVTSDPYSMIKLISLYEMYGLSDVAADLLIRYQHLVLPLMQPTYTLDDCLNNMVPACFGDGLSYQQYMAIYEDCQGRPHFLTPDILRKHGRALTSASGGIAAKRRRWAKWPLAGQTKS